jgi:2-polyprenyl-6-methoxyphenol hydroxylase-like FAD-dependent oxidoreductase
MTGEKVLIVGGGIAGLALAAGLRRDGVPCEIVERASEWQPVGAGIVMGINAMKVLRSLGVADRVAEHGRRLGAMTVGDAQARPLARTHLAELEPDFGPTYALHRADLHDLLRGAAPDVPVTLGASVDKLEPRPDCVVANLTDGRREAYRLVFGADGLRSRVRALAFGDDRIRYSGYTCWRMVVDGVETEAIEAWGRGRRFGCVGIGGGRTYAFATANAPAGTEDPLEGRRVRFRERFAGFGGPFPGIMDALHGDEALIHNDLEEVADGRWHDGRVVLLGDAAHAMTPNMGQGAAMALEDAFVLGELMRAGTPDAELGARYRARRESRVRWVQRQSRRIGRVGQLEGRFTTALRDAIVRLAPDGAPARALRRMAAQPI